MVMRSTPRGERGSVSIEMALITVFFLVPLLLGTIDGLFALSARYQANQALLSLYDYAWSNPGEANNVSNIKSILESLSQSDVAPLTIPSGFTPNYSYNCVQPDGTTTPATIASSSGAQTEMCSSGVLATYINYAVEASVSLPFPVFWVENPIDITEIGSVQIK